jgi:hypothetical protein
VKCASPIAIRFLFHDSQSRHAPVMCSGGHAGLGEINKYAAMQPLKNAGGNSQH